MELADLLTALTDQVVDLAARVDALERLETPRGRIWLDMPLTSTSYDGDDDYDSGDNSVDLVTDFGLPETAVAVYLRASVIYELASTISFGRTAGQESMAAMVDTAAVAWPLQGWVKVNTDGTINMALGQDGTDIDIQIFGYEV